MVTSAGERSEEEAEKIRAAIDTFLRESKSPVAFEPGEEQIALAPGSFELTCNGNRVMLQIWDRTRNLTRRVTAITGTKPGRLELTVERFGKKTGSLQLLDVARPQAMQKAQLEGRKTWRETFRRLLSKLYPQWRIATLSNEPDLHNTLSPTYPRALLIEGMRGMAAIGVPPNANDPDGVLAFGLIWLDYLRRRETKLFIDQLVLLMPAGSERNTGLRLLYLNTEAVRFQLLVYSEEGFVDAVELRDVGNLDTRLPARFWPVPAEWNETDELSRQISRMDQVEAVEVDDGISFRVRGLEFAKRTKEKVRFGIDSRHDARYSNVGEIERLAAELAQRRVNTSPDRNNPLYLRNPEAWLESQVRKYVSELDANLHPRPIYGQVPAFAGIDRGVIDLLAMERSGRLVVLELKASEDLQLPLQALDYWLRVKWHLDRNEFTAKGFFPGLAIARQAPRLVLIAPSLAFHPTTETILRYFSPAIDVERIGVGMLWRRNIQVAFRLQGSKSPE